MAGPQGVSKTNQADLRAEVERAKVKRALPATRNDRLQAYGAALRRLEDIFKVLGFEVVTASCPEHASLMVQAGAMHMSIKIGENKGNIAYVTSGMNYDPTLAGRRGSNASIHTSRTEMKARDLMQIVVTGVQSVPIFVELRQSIPDPELHICKMAMFVLDQAASKDSRVGRIMRDTSVLKNIPTEWLPKPGDAERLFGTAEESDIDRSIDAVRPNKRIQ